MQPLVQLLAIVVKTPRAVMKDMADAVLVDP